MAVLGLLTCALALHREALFGGPAFYERDTQLFYYPLARWVGEQLRAGVYPLWLTGIFTGYPIFADGEMGLLYLPQVLALWLLPTPEAMVWLRVLHAFLAGIFGHFFFRTLRLGVVPSLAGALVFAFGSFLSAQMHHENVVRSAVWLPLVLLLVERAFRAQTRRRRWGWLALAALAVSQAALGLHVQPVLMLALALGGYVLYRLVVGPWQAVPLPLSVGRRLWQRPLRPVQWPLLLMLGPVLGGVALASAQWLPLAEWARVSYRRGGVDYEFASAFGLAAQNLPTILFPFFFRSSDAATWWSLWQQWETELYVGIPTLALAIVGVAFSRRREVLYFLPLGVFALLVGMTHYAPIFNLHEFLWSLPGFSFLRAPGRFTYLVVFAFAGLAALGLQALADRRAPLLRLGAALLGGVPAVAALAGLLAAFQGWRAWLAADPGRAKAAIEATYLSVRAQGPIDPQTVYAGLLWSLDLANPKTLWTFVLLALTALAFVVWLGLETRRATVAQGVFAGLIAVDLLVFAADFHPKAPLASLAPGPIEGTPAGARVLVADDGLALPDLQPDAPLAAGTSTVDGYSSLPSERFNDLFNQSQALPGLEAVWAAPYVVEPLAPADQHAAGGVTFRAEHPLAAGYAGTGAATFVSPEDIGPTTSVRIVGTLSYAFDVPQGTTVAAITVANGSSPVTVPVRAGIELAERAYDRPSLRGLLQHQKPGAPTALDFEESSPQGEDYQAHLYLADLPLPSPTAVHTITVTPVHPTALVQVHGLGLVAQDGTVTPLGVGNRQGMRLLSQTPRYAVFADGLALPRAAVVDEALAVGRGNRPDETPVQVMSGPGFDPQVNVLVEGANLGPVGEPRLPASPPRAATVQDLGPNALRVTATADAPSYVVVRDFFHRGWSATVDGRPAPILIADAVFRTVRLDPGTHVVEMRFQPLSHLVGAAISLVCLAAAVLVVAYGFWPRRPAA